MSTSQATIDMHNRSEAIWRNPDATKDQSVADLLQLMRWTKTIYERCLHEYLIVRHGGEATPRLMVLPPGADGPTAA